VCYGGSGQARFYTPKTREVFSCNSLKMPILLITIDVECDKGPQWEVHYPMEFRSVMDGIPNRLMPLFREYGIRPTLLLSPEVIRSDECCRLLERLPDCELGVHLHGEFIEPDEVPSPRRTDTPQLMYPPEIEYQKLANLTSLFEARFGYRPRSFRAGRFGLSRHTLRFLAELGYRVDSSVTPFWTHYFEARGICNYWGAPIQPYFPDQRDPRKPGKFPVLESPVTIIHPQLVRWPRWLLRRIHSRSQWHKKILRILPGGPSNRPLWLRPWYSRPEEMIQVVNTVAELSPPNGTVVLNMMYHSMEVIAGASPYPQTEEEVQYHLQAQECLFNYLHQHYQVTSVGLSDLHNIFSDRNRHR